MVTGLDTVSSQHDRRWLYAGADDAAPGYLQANAWGRGACAGQADEAAVSCSSPHEAPLLECTCSPGCNGATEYCDCGTSLCMCKPGFTDNGAGCTAICPNCGANGHCVATYLGGSLLPGDDFVCACDPGYAGSRCKTTPRNIQGRKLKR